MKGHRLGTPTEIAAAATWRQVRVSRFGRRDTVEITVIDSSGMTRSARRDDVLHSGFEDAPDGFPYREFTF